MPWQEGFVPSDGFRYYFHGTYWRMEFEPCGHTLEDYHDADGEYHTDQMSYDLMKKIQDQLAWNYNQIQKVRMFPHEQREFVMNKIHCPFCEDDVKTTGIQQEVKNDHSEMPESQFKAFRYMGWV